MIAQMIESIMYFGIGFLLAALSVLIVAPLIHGRAVRLTTRQVEATIPRSMAEVLADKDLQRAEFAMSTRRLETTVEQLRTQSAGQLAELGRKGDAINRLKIELGTMRAQLSATENEFAIKTRPPADAHRSLPDKVFANLKSELDERWSVANVQKAEIITLKGQVEALKGWLAAASRKLKAKGAISPLASTVPMDSSQSPPLIDRRHEGEADTFVPTVPLDSSPSSTPNNQRHGSDAVSSVPAQMNPCRRHEDDFLHFVPKDWLTTDRDSSKSLSPKNQHHEGDLFPLEAKVSRTAEPLKAAMNSSQNLPTNSRRHESD